MEEALGMMDEGYFVSRNEIISWINASLQVLQNPFLFKFILS